MNRSSRIPLTWLALLLVVLPVTVYAAPSIRVAVTPQFQTVKAGDAAGFTITVTNTGDTNLTSIMVTGEQVIGCNGFLTGLMAGDAIAWTCSHTGVTEGFGMFVLVKGYSPKEGITTTGNASAWIRVESTAPRTEGEAVEYYPKEGESAVAKFVRYISGAQADFGGVKLWPGEVFIPTRPEGATLTAPRTPSRVGETDTEPGMKQYQGSRDHGTVGNLSIQFISRSDIFTRGEGGYQMFFTPSIESLSDGSLIAFADAMKENSSDPGWKYLELDLVYKRSTDHGTTWSPLRVLEDPGDLWAAFNSATLVDRTNGRLWVFYLRARPGRNILTSRPGTDDILNLARWSDDGGQTWSEPLDLTDLSRDMTDPAWNATIPGPAGAIQTSKGRLLVPVWKEPPGSFTIFSDNHGRTWNRGKFVPDNPGGNENQLVELADGRILMEYRQIAGPHRWLTESTDGGETWSEPWPGQNVTPVSCSIGKYRFISEGGEREGILWTGPSGIPMAVPPEGDIFARWRLVLRVSYDEERSFPFEHVIWDEASSYSDIAILDDNTLGIVWERGWQTADEFITFTRYELQLYPWE